MRSWLLAALVACTRSDDSQKEPKPPVPVPAPAPKRAVEDAGRVLLVRDVQTPSSYLAITLPDDPKATPAFESLGERPAISSFHRGKWSLAHTSGDEHQVEIGVPTMTAGGKPSYRVKVPAAPTAVRVVHDTLYVGRAGGFGWIDLSKPGAGTYVELVKRDNVQHKPYDRFAREGDRLLAIDDEVAPMYADWYSLDRAGRPVARLGDWTLPGVINGHYMAAALLPTTNDDYTLYLIATYAVRTGNGQVLAAIPIKNNQLEFDRNISLPNRDGKLPVIVEHEARGGGRKPELLVGDKLSLWMDLAIARRANKLLLAAQDRGLLVVPADFKPRHKGAEVVDLGATVWGVRAHGDRLFALVIQDSKGELVELDATSLKPIARHALPAAYHQFVD